MSSPFVAEIRMFGCNFAPTGWAQCNGQLLPLSQNTALFSLLGTNYGGDGKSTFALPNLQGSIPMHIGGDGQGPGLSPHVLGETGGVDAVTLLQSEIPAHAHLVTASQSDGTTRLPGGQLPAAGVGVAPYGVPGPLTAMHPNLVTPTGGGQPHNNLQPYLTLRFCIALQGIFPPRH